MARPNIETAAAPAVPGPLEDQIQIAAGLLMAASAAVTILYPAVLIGAGAAALWRWLYRPPAWMRVGIALLLLAPFLSLRSLTQPGWFLSVVSADVFPAFLHRVDSALIWRSVPIEVLAGPAVFEALRLAIRLARRTVGGQLRRDHRLDRAQWRAVTGHRGPSSKLTAMLPDPQIQPADAPNGHPAGFLRLALDNETRQPLDLKLPGELATHVFLPGATGSGKTTTLTRMADGALANSYGVVVIDCKAGDLGDTARDLAERYGVPFYGVDPADPDTLGYDICAGDGASVANKLVGAFAYGPNAEIYKNIAMEALPLVVGGLIASGTDVTLENLYSAFGPRGFAIISQKLDEDDRLRQRLRDLAADNDRVGISGRSGLQRRLGALQEGTFGPLFRLPSRLDWDQALSQPSVIYIGLSTLASSEDVELMGRVIAQDLKQVCARRIRAQRQAGNVVPVLAIFDEFAALREAEQLTDLLNQARQASMPVVISTQYIPESVALRKAALSAGIIVCHRVEGGDAEEIANQFGTRKATEVTHQIDFETGFAEKGSHKRVDAYNVSPNILRTLQTGDAVIRSVARRRHAIVHIYPD